MANNNKGSIASSSTNNRSKRGFASMDEDKQREIASQGGKAAHQKGTAHEFDSAEGQAAGRLGGQARQNNHNAGQGPTEVGTPSDLLETNDLP